MGDQEAILEYLYVLWVEAQILHWADKEFSEEAAENIVGFAENVLEETSRQAD